MIFLVKLLKTQLIRMGKYSYIQINPSAQLNASIILTNVKRVFLCLNLIKMYHKQVIGSKSNIKHYDCSHNMNINACKPLDCTCNTIQGRPIIHCPIIRQKRRFFCLIIYIFRDMRPCLFLILYQMLSHY